jgi:hypothetical protein
MRPLLCHLSYAAEIALTRKTLCYNPAERTTNSNDSRDASQDGNRPEVPLMAWLSNRPWRDDAENSLLAEDDAGIDEEETEDDDDDEDDDDLDDLDDEDDDDDDEDDDLDDDEVEAEGDTVDEEEEDEDLANEEDE